MNLPYWLEYFKIFNSRTSHTPHIIHLPFFILFHISHPEKKWQRVPARRIYLQEWFAPFWKIAGLRKSNESSHALPLRRADGKENPPSLDNHPVKILLLIADQLDIVDQVCLQNTSRFFRQLVKVDRTALDGGLERVASRRTWKTILPNLHAPFAKRFARRNCPMTFRSRPFSASKADIYTCDTSSVRHRCGAWWRILRWVAGARLTTRTGKAPSLLFRKRVSGGSCWMKIRGLVGQDLSAPLLVLCPMHSWQRHAYDWLFAMSVRFLRPLWRLAFFSSRSMRARGGIVQIWICAKKYTPNTL